MRNKTDNPPPEITQAPPASPEPASPAQPTFHLRDWVRLHDAVLKFKDLAGGSGQRARDLGVEEAIKYLRDLKEPLKSTLRRADGTRKSLTASDWAYRSIYVPPNPAEGIFITPPFEPPFQPGDCFVCRTDLARLTSPSPRAEAELVPARIPPAESASSETLLSPPSPPTESTLSPSEPSATREPPAEDVERRRLLQLPEEPQLEESRKWQPNEAQTWLKSMRKTHPQQPGENKSDYARRLYDRMTNDFDEDIPWSGWETLLRRLNDPVIADDD
jgi:hypothetical protein